MMSCFLNSSFDILHNLVVSLHLHLELSGFAFWTALFAASSKNQFTNWQTFLRVNECRQMTFKQPLCSANLQLNNLKVHLKNT